VPTKPEGVYPDGKGGWYLKVNIGRDPISGCREQLTRRGFATAAEAGRARRELLGKVDRGELKPIAGGMLIDELMNLYLDGLDADGRLSEKTRFDYRHSADDYVRPHLGKKRVRDVTPEVILAWQRKLTKDGGTKRKVDEDGKQKPGKGLSPNTVRLARAPLSGAFKLAMSVGLVASNPTAQVPRPRPKRSIPKHWTPEQAREFLGLMEKDRTWPIWAFLLGSGPASESWYGCAGPTWTSTSDGFVWWTLLPPSVTISFRRWERATMQSARLSSTADSSMYFSGNGSSRRKKR
jgi:hypothetical protein